MKNRTHSQNNSGFHKPGVERNRDTPQPQGRFPLRFMFVTSSLTVVLVFSGFCLTVRSFPGGGIRVEGPGGLKVEAQLGSPSSPVQPPQSYNRK